MPFTQKEELWYVNNYDIFRPDIKGLVEVF